VLSFALAIAAVGTAMSLAWSPAVHAQLQDRSIRSTERDGPGAEYSLGSRLYLALSFNQPEYIGRLFLEAGEQPRLTDGRPTVAAIYDGFADMLSQEKQWDRSLAEIRKWQIREPGNPQAQLTEAAYWIAYGRFARGSDFIYKVPPRALELMHDRMSKAAEVLETIRPSANANPMWYALMLNAAMMDGWPETRRAALFAEAVHADPYFFATYVPMANSLTPRWGGDLRTYHDFVEAAVKRTSAKEGISYYARLYWILAGIEWDRAPFRDLGIPWPKMKSGFDDLMQRYPDSQWNLHHYARFACLADDGKTFNKLRPSLDLNAMNRMPPVWSGAYTLEFCTEQFSKRT
jgi:hypothetical protein